MGVTGRTIRSLGAPVLAAMAVACSGATSSDDSTTSAAAPSTSIEPSVTAAVSADPTVEGFDDGPLDEVCPSTIVVQTERLPDVSLGALYALLPSNPTIDDGGQRVSGPIRRADGSIDDVSIELRSGGPAVGFRSPIRLLADDRDVHLAVEGFADLVVSGATDAQGVVALAPANREAIMWDPSAFPEIAGLADVRDAGITVRHATGDPAAEFLAATGVLDPAQLEAGGDTGLAAFITGAGAIARLGDGLVDPLLLGTLPEWGRPLEIAAASTGGWDDVDPIVIRAGDGRIDDECLGRLVPILQGATRSYSAAPGPVNELMVAIRSRFDPLDRISATLLDDAAALLIDEGATWNGPPGAFDVEPLGRFAEEIRAAFEIDAERTTDLVSNRFVTDLD